MYYFFIVTFVLVFLALSIIKVVNITRDASSNIKTIFLKFGIFDKLILEYRADFYDSLENNKNKN